MSGPADARCYQGQADVIGNAQVSSGLIRLDLELARPVAFQPGQFAMLNLMQPFPLVFGRPFSIYDSQGTRVSFLYRCVGTGTAAMAGLQPGAVMSFLGPLGRPFPADGIGRPVILLAGGVGLPPLAAWWSRHGMAGDLAFFGARSGDDVPWGELDGSWQVSTEESGGIPPGRQAHTGLVTELAQKETDFSNAAAGTILACGPVALLQAAWQMAAARSWACFVSLEEHMGCGYGVCKGCVIPVLVGEKTEQGIGNATCCQDGPVFDAARIAWDRFLQVTD